MKTKNKIKHLFEKDFELKEKALTAALIGLAVSFNFIFFGMIYIYISNNEDFMIPITSVLRVALIISLLTWAGISLLLFILPGRIHTIAASFVTGLILAGYLQGNVLNSLTPLGELTGDAIYWRMFAKETLVNTAIWLVLFLLPVALRILTNAKTWKTAVLIICVLLTGMQASALVITYMSERENIGYKAESYLSREGAYELSEKNNILIFVIDRLDYSYVNAVRDNDPDFFTPLDGFTEFTNAAANYEATFPSGVFMTTGVPYDYEMKRAEYFDYAWNNSKFITKLKESGYTTRYHMTENYMYSNISQIEYAADNIKPGWPDAAFNSIAVNFITMAAYRFVPMALKPSFWIYTIEFEMSGNGNITEKDYVAHNDPLFLELLEENGLSLQNRTKNYYYLHLYGAHAPYTMDENGRRVEMTDLVTQTKGCFNILYRYMDEMKQLGVYEDSTIIIMGDHGWGSFHIGFFVKPAGSAGTPLQQNNAPVSISDNLLATILMSEGIDYSGFGIPAFDVEQNTPGERYLARYERLNDTVEFYKVTGMINNAENWELVDAHDFLVDFNLGLPID